MAQLGIGMGLLVSFAALPPKIQKASMECITKLMENPAAPGLNYERIQGWLDKNLYSVRINNNYRCILSKQQDTYSLLWVDKHDDAYKWAEKRKCIVNPSLGCIQVYNVIEKPAEIHAAAEKPKLFSKLEDKDLTDLGVPEDILPVIRNISDVNDFYAVQDSLPPNAYEYLSWYVEGEPLSDIKAVLDDNRGETFKQTVSYSFAEALKNPETLRSFVIVDNEEELRSVLEAPLEKWRVFLHPDQRKSVYKTYKGSARVLGSAGTGKTVVAMHRAKQLASKLSGQDKLLFTTFTANLASDIRNNLKKICQPDVLSRIEVVNLDAWAAQFLKEHDCRKKIIYEAEKLKKYWEDAVIENGVTSFSAGFCEDEFRRVAAAQDAFSKEKYIKANRNGRGIKLDRKMRLQIWDVFESYLKTLEKQKILDSDLALYECRQLIEQLNAGSLYKHVIVDEGQDFSANAYKLIRAIAGTEHENDIFIVGDAHQRIYKNKVKLSDCGINVRGKKSSVLRINYRTTEEIRKAAFAVLKDIAFDDLDGEAVEDNGGKSLTKGVAPQVFRCKDANEELNTLLTEIKKLTDEGVPLENICVVARTHKLLDDYIAEFKKNGLACYEIRTEKGDERERKGLRTATMHRVKGLEFQYVFIAAANDKIIPLSSAISTADKVSEQETAEKCLLYVAMTRAQKGVYISGYGHMSKLLDGLA